MDFTEKELNEFIQKMKTAKSSEDLFGTEGLIKNLTKTVLEKLLKEEMDEHLGYKKKDPSGNKSGNSRNGSSSKTVISNHGDIQLDIPRDRNAEFEPIAVPKHKRRLGKIEDAIISLYAKGMTTRDIRDYLEEIYGIDMSPQFISNVTDNIMDLVKEWQYRPLDLVYPIVFLDAIHYNVRQDGKVLSKAAYTCLGINLSGNKDLLGIWIGNAESSKFWLNILNELKQRGVKDILIACVDGLTGFSDAISAVFPETLIQKCIIHQIRNSLKYVAQKHHKDFTQDLKYVYNAPTQDAARIELDILDQKWGKSYSAAIDKWKKNWNELTTFYSFPPELKSVIYTTNAVEALHRQFRKVTKTKSVFPNDEALTKSLFLAFRDVSKKWTVQGRNWGLIVNQLSIIFDKRITDFL